MISISPKVKRFLLGILILMPVGAGAQSSVSFSVSPTIFDMTANPGQVFRSTLRVINANPYDLEVFIETSDFRPRGETGTPEFIPKTETEPGTTLAHWITTEQSITIPAEQTIELPFTITLPPDASPGGHFGALMVSTRPVGGDAAATQVQTAQVISSLLFLRVTGDVVEQSTVRSFRTSRYLMSRPEATFDLRIENRGNVHVQPQGEIKIKNMWGQERGTVLVNQQSLFGNVLPNSVRKYSFTWSGEWSVTDIGRYTAEVTLAYGQSEKRFMNASTAFWVIPWKFLLIIFTVIGSFFWLLSWAIRSYVKRMIALAGVPTSTVSKPPVKTATAAQSVALPVNGAKVPKKKLASAMAPIEDGMLDLRTRMRGAHSVGEYAHRLMQFIRAYWKFFVVFAAVALFLILVAWFVRGAFTPERPFEVTIQDDSGNQVRVSSETATTTEEQTPTESVQKEQNFTLVIINRSGDPTLGDVVAGHLATKGYVVARVQEEAGAAEERTVIVYDPKESSTALSLSEILDTKLISAFTDESSMVPTITLYLGTETISTAATW